MVAHWEVVRRAKGEILLGDVGLSLIAIPVEKEKCWKKFNDMGRKMLRTMEEDNIKKDNQWLTFFWIANAARISFSHL